MTDTDPVSPASEGTDLNVHRERYRVFIEDVADGFYETDLRGNFRFFNNALCRIFGYKRSEIQDRNFREFMDQNNAAIAFESFNRIYRTGRNLADIKWEITRKDGERRILEISASLIVDNGRKVGFRGIARDVTEKYLAQQASRECELRAQQQYRASRRAEERYRAFLKFLPDPVFVFNLDSTVSYLNPAFEKVFGWTLGELKGKRIPFVPEDLKEETRQGTERLFEENVLHGLQTRRLTKDGRLLDIILDGAIFYDEENEPAGQVLILRDITREKRVERSNQALFRIAKALHHYRRLDDLLEFITREVQSRIAVEAASVILLDEEKNEFFFREGTYDDTEAGKKFKEIRFPADKGVAGQVYKSGQPLIVPDTSQCPFFFQKVDQKAGYRTRNILDVPIWIQERMIGVLCAVNKKDGPFDTTDVELLSAIASIAALPLENARINEKLKRSYEEVKSMSRAKDRVIHHLSHELKTPLSVLAASLGLLTKKLTGLEDRGWKRIMDRAERNLQRILEMQYEIEDILRERDYKSYYMLSILLEACADELEVLVSGEVGQDDVLPKIRGRIEELFGPRESISQEVDLTRGVEQIVASIRPRFAHRKCRLKTRFDPTVSAFIPPDVLTKIVEGLIRNAVENTPDGGRIDVSVRNGRKGPEFEVKDNGVGITEENQRLILEGNLTSYETLQYSSRKPYDFNAGGKGFDLLRMKIFSERYHFNIRMNSRRCPFIPQNVDICPGRIDDCDHSRETTDCSQSGGTTMIIQFSSPDRMSSRNKDKG